MKSGFCDTLLKINNNNDIMKDIVLLSFTGLYVIMINYRFYNKINKLQSKNRDLQDKVEYLKYELSKHNSLTINSDTNVSPGPEAPRLSNHNDIVFIDRE